MSHEREYSPEQLLTKQVAIVTGGAQGVGKGIATCLAREGAQVVIADIDHDVGAYAAQELNELRSGCALAVQADTSNEESLFSLYNKVIGHFGTVDILVNNVGITTGRKDLLGLMDLVPLQLRRVYETNIIGPLYLTQQVARQMIQREQGGTILFTSSIHDHTPRRNLAYSSSKAALGMIVKEVALELAPHSITVNAIAPGAVSPTEERRPNPHVPIGRNSTPEEVGALAAFLASPHARTLTGQTLVVDGGLSLASIHDMQQRGFKI